MSEGEDELNVGAVRLEEVASAANVSLSTASKALRGKPHVSEKTRIRVIDAAQRLVVPEFLRTLVFARPRGDDQFADCTFSPSLDMSR